MINSWMAKTNKQEERESGKSGVGCSCAAALGSVWCVVVSRLAASQVKPCSPSSVVADALGCCTWPCEKVTESQNCNDLFLPSSFLSCAGVVGSSARKGEGAQGSLQKGQRKARCLPLCASSVCSQKGLKNPPKNQGAWYDGSFCPGALAGCRQSLPLPTLCTLLPVPRTERLPDRGHSSSRESQCSQ